MDFDFTKTMAKAADEELIKIVTADRENYQEAAILAAQLELTKRNLPLDLIEQTKQVQATQKEFDVIKANTPLDTHWKILTFLFPAIFQLIISGFFKSNGYERKSNELAKWTIYGIGFYFLLVILASI